MLLGKCANGKLDSNLLRTERVHRPESADGGIPKNRCEGKPPSSPCCSDAETETERKPSNNHPSCSHAKACALAWIEYQPKRRSDHEFGPYVQLRFASIRLG
jgi:hypothetical protein